MDDPFEHIGMYRDDDPAIAGQPIIYTLLDEAEEATDIFEQMADKVADGEEAAELLRLYSQKICAIYSEMGIFFKGVMAFPTFVEGVHAEAVRRGE